MFPLRAATQASWNRSRLTSPKLEERPLISLFRNPGKLAKLPTDLERYTSSRSHFLCLSHFVWRERQQAGKQKGPLYFALIVNYSSQKPLSTNFVLNLQNQAPGKFSTVGHLLKI